MISVLIPSRGRVERLLETIKSFEGLGVEILVAVDEDDPQLDAYQRSHLNLFITPRYGYAHLEKYFNDLAGNAKGEWLLPWNDDARLVEGNPEELVKDLRSDRFHVVIFGGDKHFPMMSRGLYDWLGHVSMGPSVDSYLHALGVRGDILKDREAILVEHDRDILHDATTTDRINSYEAMDVRMEGEVVKSREDDIKKIKSWREPKWTICIATVPPREKELERLMKRLMPQVDRFKGQIEVLVYFNNFERSLGYLRQKMIEEARGEYVSHIDDDDLVPEDYCDTIFPLLDGVDYIGFQVDFRDRGKKMLPVYHSLKYPRWYQDERGYYRGITHLNPIRTKLALTSKFPSEYTIGEDEQWANGIKAETEHVIDRPMYIYLHQGDESVAYKYTDNDEEAKEHHRNFRPKPVDTPRRPTINGIYYRFHPESTRDGKTN